MCSHVKNETFLFYTVPVKSLDTLSNKILIKKKIVLIKRHIVIVLSADEVSFSIYIFEPFLSIWTVME